MTETPILNTLVHPPLSLMKRELISGTFTGSGDLTRPALFPPFPQVNAYGLTWSFFTVPAPFGFEFGDPNIYEHRMLQLSTVHQDQTGHELVSEFHDFRSEGLYWFWETPFPSRVHYEITPGVVVVFHWLIFFLP